MEKTYKEVIEANGGEPVEFKVAVPTKGVRRIDEEGEPYVTDGDGYLTATCWTDDEDILPTAAAFDVDTSWSGTFPGIGRYDNQHGELDGEIGQLIDKIAAKFGGEWVFDAAENMIYQR